MGVAIPPWPIFPETIFFDVVVFLMLWSCLAVISGNISFFWMVNGCCNPSPPIFPEIVIFLFNSTFFHLVANFLYHIKIKTSIFGLQSGKVELFSLMLSGKISVENMQQITICNHGPVCVVCPSLSKKWPLEFESDANKNWWSPLPNKHIHRGI